MNSRTENDSFGNIEVPTVHFWGAQTQRSLLHFHISTETMPEEIIFALAEVKRACARVNCDLGLLEAEKAYAIIDASGEVLPCVHVRDDTLIGHMNTLDAGFGELTGK